MTMTTETSYTDVLGGLYAAVASGRPDEALPHLADDVVLHVPGGQPLAGDHVGPEAVVAFITASSTVADRTEQVEVLDVLVGGAHAAAYCHVTGSRPDGPDLDNRTIHLFRITDGRIAEVWFHNWDQAAVDAFWS